MLFLTCSIINYFYQDQKLISFMIIIQFTITLFSSILTESKQYSCFLQILCNKYVQLNIFMQFREDSISDFINFKLHHPQALQEQMKLLQDRKECITKLDEYSKQMDLLRNQHHMYQQVLDTLTAKRTYIQQNYDSQKQQLQKAITIYKERIDQSNRDKKQKQNINEVARKKYDLFKKELAQSQQKLFQNFKNQMTSLIEEKQALIKDRDQKIRNKSVLQQELVKLRDKEIIIKNTEQNVQTVKNKWQTRQSQFVRVKEQFQKRQKEIHDQINYSNSMEKVIYGNFYKRCSQVVGEMKSGLNRLYEMDDGSIVKLGWEEGLEQLLLKLKSNTQDLRIFIVEKRQKYKLGASLPEPDAELYNNIVETKINPDLLNVIYQQDYESNNTLIRQIEDGQNQMMKQLETELARIENEEKSADATIGQLENRVQQFQEFIQSKKKMQISPKKNRKN